MTEDHGWHQYITDAEKTQDTAMLRKLVSDCALELDEAEKRISHLERELHSEDRRAEFAKTQLAKAAAARARIASQAVAALRELVPQAKAQAKKGKPALLRMILRATR
jgi:hypothetical protein